MNSQFGESDVLRYIEMQRMYDTIRERLIKEYELEKDSVDLEAVNFINVGLGLLVVKKSTRDILSASSILGIIEENELHLGEQFQYNAEKNLEKKFSLSQNFAIKRIRAFENDYKNGKFSDNNM